MGGDRMGLGRADLSELPEGCIADAVALTTPRDACALSSVSSVFKSAAESDAVWRKLLPADIHAVMSRSVDSSAPQSYSSLKNLYLSLCDHPILIDGGKLSFSLCKRSGKKCYMISARGLSIAWGDTPRYWYWTSTPDSRFGEVAELNIVCWLEISGKIRVCMLSPGTVYGAYLVFKGTEDSYGFACQPVDVKLGLVGGGEATERSIYLINEKHGNNKPNFNFNFNFNFNLRGYTRNALVQHVHLYKQQQQQQDEQMMSSTSNVKKKMSSSSSCDCEAKPKERRRDGWWEVELGDLFIGGGDGEVEIRVSEVKVCNWKRGLIVEGIEFRPKHPSSLS